MCLIDQQNNFISTADGAAVIDVAPYFGHPEADLALVDYFSPVHPEVLRAYGELGPLDPGFAGRRELWRLHAYLAVIAVDGAGAFGRSFLPRLADAVRRYALPPGGGQGMSGGRMNRPATFSSSSNATRAFMSPAS